MSKSLIHLVFARMAMAATTALLLTAGVPAAEAQPISATSPTNPTAIVARSNIFTGTVSNLDVLGTLHAENIVTSSNLFGDGSGLGVFFERGSHVGETPGGILSLTSYNGIELSSFGVGIVLRTPTSFYFSLFTAQTNFGNWEFVTNDMVAGGAVRASNVFVNSGQIFFTNMPSATPQGIVTKNTPTNSFFNGALGPIYLPSSSSVMILTNAWAYTPGPGTNQQVFITLTSPLVTFSEGTSFGASQTPVAIMITNFGGGSSGGIVVTSNTVPNVAPGTGLKSGGTIVAGNTFPGAIEGIGSNLGLRTGATGYSLYYTNTVNGVGRFASALTIVSQ